MGTDQYGAVIEEGIVPMLYNTTEMRGDEVINVNPHDSMVPVAEEMPSQEVPHFFCGEFIQFISSEFVEIINIFLIFDIKPHESSSGKWLELKSTLLFCK